MDSVSHVISDGPHNKLLARSLSGLETAMSKGSVPDGQLMKRCREGDTSAFDTLYGRYRLQLFSYLNRLLPGQTAVVDDLFQETWIKVLKNVESYTDKERFLSWAFRIAHNVAIDHIRRNSRRESVPVDERLPAPEHVPWESMDREVIKHKVAEAIEELSVDQREVVLLRQRGVPFKEIAEIQDVSINTVLGRMHYAVKRLQKELGEYR